MSQPSPSQAEQEHHKRAFEEFYALGPKRTYQHAADKLGLSASTVKLYCRTYNWRQRIAERDAEAVRQMADRSGQVALDERARDVKVVRATKVKLARDILEGRVKGTLRDLEMLIRLDAELSGGADAHLSWIDRETDPEKLRTRLREIAAAELPVIAPTEERPSDG